MKKIENSFVVSGYVSNDAQIRSFETASVARFSIAVSRKLIQSIKLCKLQQEQTKHPL